MFRKKRKTGSRKRRRTVTSKQDFQKITKDIQDLQTQASATNTILHKHGQDITRHETLLERHSEQLDTLEQLVLRPTVYPANIDFPTVNRPEASLNPAVSAQRQSQQQIQRFDIARFSEQEKRILTVFFQNKDMALSYADIAKYLGKSPNTIKNQMRQVSMKADLFNYTVGDESRKRFKLKDGLKIEKYLGISEDPTRWLARAIELDGMADRNRLDERPSRP